MLALCEMCLVLAWGKYVLRAWGQLKMGVFEVLALGEMCFEGMGRVEKGV